MIFNYIRESYSNWISRNPSKIKPEYLIQWPLDTCTVKLVIIEIYMYFEIARGHFKCIILLKLFYMRSLSPLPMKAFAHGGRNLHSNRIRQGGFKGGRSPPSGSAKNARDNILAGVPRNSYGRWKFGKITHGAASEHQVQPLSYNNYRSSYNVPAARAAFFFQVYFRPCFVGFSLHTRFFQIDLSQWVFGSYEDFRTTPSMYFFMGNPFPNGIWVFGHSMHRVECIRVITSQSQDRVFSRISLLSVEFHWFPLIIVDFLRFSLILQ